MASKAKAKAGNGNAADRVVWPSPTEVKVISPAMAFRSVSEIAQECGLDTKLTNTLLGRAKRKGYVERKGERRSRAYRLTPLGKKAVRAYKLLHG